MKRKFQILKSVISSAARDLLFLRSSLVLCAMALAIAFALRAQQPQPAHLPGEPHHHLKIDNSYVRAYYVEVAPHESTQLHQHDLDYFFASLGPADIINAPQDKPELHQVIKDGEIHFARGGFAHVARNLSDQPFRNITVEFLRPQGNVRNRCEKVVPGDLGPCITERRLNSYTDSPWFESDEMIAELWEIQPKASFLDVPSRDRLVVALDQAKLTVETRGKPIEKLGSGGLLWLPQGAEQTFRNASDRPSRFLLIAFKDSDKSARH